MTVELPRWETGDVITISAGDIIVIAVFGGKGLSVDDAVSFPYTAPYN